MTQPSGWLRLAAVSASLAAGACGSDTAAESQRIGAAGGTVETAGATLDVPAGALQKEVDITIVSSTEVAPSGFTSYSPVFEFEPSGLEFAVPAVVTIAFDGAPDPSIVWSLPGGSGFEMLATDRAGTVATAQVTHFSRGFAGYSDVQVDAGACDGGEIPCDGMDNDCDPSTPDEACGEGESCLDGQCAAVCGHRNEPCCPGNVCFGGGCIQPGNVCLPPS